MKKLIISTIGILILVPFIHAKQNPKHSYNSNQLKYRDIKNKIIENEQNLLLNEREINSKKIDQYSSTVIIKKDPREKAELRRAKKSLHRDKVSRVSSYAMVR